MEIKSFIYYDILEFTRNRDKLCELLVEYGIFASEITCPTCRKAEIDRKLKLDNGRLKYYCNATIRLNKKRAKRCNYSISARKGTFFSAHLEPETILKYVFLFFGTLIY